jgi:cell division protein FtsL
MRSIRRFFLILLILFLLSSLTRNFFEYQKNISFYEDFKEEYEEAKQDNTNLKTQIIKNSDPNQVEKVIRNKLNLLKENEVAIIIAQPTPTPVSITPTPQPVYQQWITLFFRN